MKYLIKIFFLFIFFSCRRDFVVEPSPFEEYIFKKEITKKNEEVFETFFEEIEEEFFEKIGGCDGCGTGSLKGIVCAPNGMVAIPDALVWVDTKDCKGNNLHFETYSDENGEYFLENIPCGMQTIHIEKGSFKMQFNIFIDQGITNDVSSKIGNRCFSPNSAKLAVTGGEWDNIQGILEFLNLNYDFYQLYEGGKSSGGEWKEGAAVQFLKNLEKMKEYDVIFINCGAPHLQILKEEEIIISNLKDFVNSGGSLYISDWAFPYIEWAWENAIDFHGTDKSNEPIALKGNQTIVGKILDEKIAKYIGGKSEIEIKFIAGPLVSVHKAGAGVFVHISGYVQQFEEVQPFLLSFIPKNAKGKVIYTNFHNQEQITEDMAIILNYLVFLL